jgi:lactoylglutathione lyase
LSEHEVKMIILSTDDLDESIRLYSETLGMALKFRDGAHFAALDGGPVTLALATDVDHPIPGQVVVGIKTADVDAAAKAVEASGGGIGKGRTTTHTNVAPWCTTTRATAWSSTSHWPAETRPAAPQSARGLTDRANSSVGPSMRERFIWDGCRRSAAPRRDLHRRAHPLRTFGSRQELVKSDTRFASGS